jgi:hypothetical protein
LLTPGILVSLPPKASSVVVALTHALVFTLLMSLTYYATKKGKSQDGMMYDM